VCELAVVRQLGGIPAARCSPHGVAPTPGRPVQVVDMGLWVHPYLLVKDGQLFVELALGLREFVKSHSSLGVGGAMTRHRLRVRAAQS
jgi:hypothetical protein